MFTHGYQGQQYVYAGELIALQTMTNVLNYLKVKKIDIGTVCVLLICLQFTDIPIAD